MKSRVGVKPVFLLDAWLRDAFRRNMPYNEMVRELLTAGLKLIPDGRDTGELKLITTAVKELRYAYRVFGQYREPHKVTIFGSARVNEETPEYRQALARCLQQAGRQKEAEALLKGAAPGEKPKTNTVSSGRDSCVRYSASSASFTSSTEK